MLWHSPRGEVRLPPAQGPHDPAGGQRPCCLGGNRTTLVDPSLPLNDVRRGLRRQISLSGWGVGRFPAPRQRRKQVLPLEGETRAREGERLPTSARGAELPRGQAAPTMRSRSRDRLLRELLRRPAPNTQAPPVRCGTVVPVLHPPPDGRIKSVGVVAPAAQCKARPSPLAGDDVRLWCSRPGAPRHAAPPWLSTPPDVLATGLPAPRRLNDGGATVAHLAQTPTRGYTYRHGPLKGRGRCGDIVRGGDSHR